MDLNLQVAARPDGSIFASYTCPCGCNPGVALAKGTEIATEGCCCGNEFAVGHAAASHIVAQKFVARPGYQLQVQALQAPWGEKIEAAWAVGQSQHPAADGPGQEAGHGHGHGHDGGAGQGKAIDPVCGMTVDTETAKGKGLHFQHAGKDYYFCGRGCRLDFEEDPARFLDPRYIPSM